MASKRDLVEESFGLSAPDYVRSPYFGEPGRKLVEAGKISSGDRVLDIATGRGAVLFPAAASVAPDGFVEGIDLAGPMVELTAVDIKSRAVRNARVSQMDAEDLAFPDQAFDVVLCGFALFFIPDLDRALNEVKRVLKKPGRFAVTTWAGSEGLQKDFAEVSRRFGADRDPLTSHSLSTAETLTAALVRNGFADVSAKYETLVVHFATPEEWWQQQRSSPLLKQLSPTQIDELGDEVLELAREHSTPSGLEVTRKYLIATAVSSG